MYRVKNLIDKAANIVKILRGLFSNNKLKTRSAKILSVNNLCKHKATVKVTPTNAGKTSIFVGATFTVALFAQFIYRKQKSKNAIP